MIKAKRINNVKIMPLEIPRVDPECIKGKEFFEDLTPNVLLVARKNSGKTTVLYHILRNCVNKRTKVFIFCSTVYKDPSYQLIVKMLSKRGVDVELFTDVREGKQNYLDEMVEEFKKMEEGGNIFDEKEREKDEDIKFLMFGGKQKKIKPKEPKKKTPKYAFIFDDISEDLRSPSIAYLMKKNRHFGIMNIISTQSYKDITPPAWSQIDFALLYPGLDLKTVSNIRTKMGLSVEDDELEQLYTYATEEKYNFLYIDKQKGTFRHNFCEKLVLK